MANPTLYDFAEEPAKALGGTVDPKTGIKHQAFDIDDNSEPSVFSRLMNIERKFMLLAAGANRGQVVWSGSGLTVGAYALEYALGATAYSFAGDATYSLSLPVSETSYVYLDADETLESQITSWPSGDHIKLAKVTTNGSEVTGIVDCRWMNFQVGVTSAWWNYAAQGPVNLNDSNLLKTKLFGLSLANILTLDANGEITPSQSMHTVDTYQSAATDDLTDIEYDINNGSQLLILGAYNAARTVVVKDGVGNIILNDGDFALDDTTKRILLIQAGTHWHELSRNFNTLQTLAAALDANGQTVRDIGLLSLKQGSDLTIASGAITVTGSRHKVETEGSISEDDLDTINGGSYVGQIVELQSKPGGNCVTLKHGTDNLKLANGKDYVLDGGTGFVCRRIALEWDGTYWVELYRSHPSIADLVETALAIPYSLGPIVLSGALSVKVYEIEVYCHHGFTIKNVAGRVNTAPSGGACIIDIRDDGNSIFANQADMINIADGANYDLSATVNHWVAAGSVLTVEVEAANGAQDATVSINGFIAPKTPPT